MVGRGHKRDRDTRMERSYRWAQVRGRRVTRLAWVSLFLALVILPSAASADEGDLVALVVGFGDGRLITRLWTRRVAWASRCARWRAWDARTLWIPVSASA